VSPTLAARGAGDLVGPNSKNSQGVRLQKACRNDPAAPNSKCTESIPG